MLLRLHMSFNSESRLYLEILQALLRECLGKESRILYSKKQFVKKEKTSLGIVKH